MGKCADVQVVLVKRFDRRFMRDLAGHNLAIMVEIHGQSTIDM
jgi:hypothetical protein